MSTELQQFVTVTPASMRTPRESLVRLPGLLVAADPVTIQAILTGAGIVVSLFGAVDNHRHHRRIEQLLRSIQAGLVAVNQRLDHIIAAMQALRVHIDLAFAGDAWLTLQSRLQMVFVNYPVWEADGRDGKKDASAVLRDLEVDIGKLISYGYAHYHRVGLAIAVSVPVMIVAGRDRSYARRVTAPTRFADAITTNIQGAELVVFEGCAHAPIYEKVEEFNDKTLEFLQQHSG